MDDVMHSRGVLVWGLGTVTRAFVEVAGKRIHDADIVATMQVYRIRHR